MRIQKKCQKSNTDDNDEVIGAKLLKNVLLRKYASQNNSHVYSKSHIMEPQHRSVCTGSMRSANSGILFCFLRLLKTSRHFFGVNGTFECLPHRPVFHLLPTYLIVNGAFVSPRLTISKAETGTTTVLQHFLWTRIWRVQEVVNLINTGNSSSKITIYHY